MIKQTLATFIIGGFSLAALAADLPQAKTNSANPRAIEILGKPKSIDRKEFSNQKTIKVQEQFRQKASKSQITSLGTANGGGGNASEIEVDEIRIDILKWIKNGGPSAFKEFPEEVNLNIYTDRMIRILQPHAVVVGFVSSQQENETSNPELKVVVNGQPKQCRGFVSKEDQRPHILCNSDRYPKEEADQYRLIHHEYAGLAGIEKNDGASSDYILSNQLSAFLENQIVKRLAIKPRPSLSLDEHLGIGDMPRGTTIIVPLNYTLWPTRDSIDLPALQTSDGKKMVCSLRVWAASDSRVYRGLLLLKTKNTPQRQSMYDYIFTISIGENTLNGIALDNWNATPIMECTKSLISDKSTEYFNIEEFRRYIEFVGGRVTYPPSREL